MTSPKVWIYTAPHNGIGGFQRYARAVINYVGQEYSFGIYDTNTHPEAAAFVQSPLTKTKAANPTNFGHLTLHSRLSNEIDLLHYPAQFYAFRLPKVGYSPPHSLPEASSFVMTIHDLAFKYVGGGPLEDTMQQVRRNKKDLDHVITVSEFSKADIVDYLDIADDRVTVIPNCVDTTVFNPKEGAEDEQILSRYDIDYPYLFHLSNGGRRKRVKELVQAFHQAEINCSLILAAGAARSERIQSLVTNLELHDEVKFLTDYLTDEQLAAIYRYAQALVLPSSLEGFGYPVIEALACGTECLLTNTTALPEVGGEVCRYVPVDDVDALTEGIEALNSVEESFEAGVKHVEENFSPKYFAQQHIQVYEQFLD